MNGFLSGWHRICTATSGPVPQEARTRSRAAFWPQVIRLEAANNLARKPVEMGAAVQQVLEWLASPAAGQWGQGSRGRLSARVFAEQFDVVPSAGAPQPRAKPELSTARVQNPHDPDATYAAKGRGERVREFSLLTLPAGIRVLPFLLMR
jgi:hypothetical protein